MTLTNLIVLAGIGQLCILVASAMVPFRLKWNDELRPLPRLHRQMHWVYGGYVVLSIVAFAVLSILNARELASGSGLARGVCAYVAVFWGIRLALQAVFDIHTLPAAPLDEGRLRGARSAVRLAHGDLRVGSRARGPGAVTSATLGSPPDVGAKQRLLATTLSATGALRDGRGREVHLWQIAPEAVGKTDSF